MWHSARWYVAAVVPSTEAEVVRGECGTEALVVSGIEPGWYVASMLPMVVVFFIWKVRGEFGSEAALVRVTRGGGGGTWRSGDDDLCNTAEVREATGAESLTEVW